MRFSSGPVLIQASRTYSGSVAITNRVKGHEIQAMTAKNTRVKTTSMHNVNSEPVRNSRMLSSS
ncbi:hypothetical protein D3C73_1402500 [compost metagenome]